MAQKPIDKITIHDITERCGIRRQNFYYHFEDMYDLMRWMFQEEAMSLCASMRAVSYTHLSSAEAKKTLSAGASVI